MMIPQMLNAHPEGVSRVGYMALTCRGCPPLKVWCQVLSHDNATVIDMAHLLDRNAQPAQQAEDGCGQSGARRSLQSVRDTSTVWRQTARIDRIQLHSGAAAYLAIGFPEPS